jgi:hypothetical protein
LVDVITDIVIVVAAALLIGVYVSWRAGRIDRLHARVEMARAALDVTLLRRSSVALELATLRPACCWPPPSTAPAATVSTAATARVTWPRAT